ncbi:MAG: TIGR03087 family PEP-CTERM/XrtA system glycosyltransferase [Gammaproteobacteria bacterium]
MKKIIYLAHRIPFPPNKGDKIRSYHILKYLRSKYEVYLGTFIDEADDERFIPDIKKTFQHVCIDRPRLGKAIIRSLLNRDSISEELYYSKRLEKWIADLIHTESIDAMICFSSAIGQYALKFKDRIKTHIVDYVDVDSEKWRAYGLKRIFPLNLVYLRESKKLLSLEMAIAKSVSASLFVTEDEAKLFERLTNLTEDIHAIYNGVDTDYFNPDSNFESPYNDGDLNIVFTGRMDYWPNVEAVKWFCLNVFKTLQSKIPNIKFYIVGAKPTQAVQNLANIKNVIVTGQVSDIRPYLKYATLCVAPLQIGRGVQNKVLEAMAMRVPMVVSESALTGIQCQPNLPIIIANSEVEWQQSLSDIINRYPNFELRSNLRKNILDQYSWNHTLKPLTNLLERHG